MSQPQADDLVGILDAIARIDQHLTARTPEVPPCVAPDAVIQEGVLRYVGKDLGKYAEAVAMAPFTVHRSNQSLVECVPGGWHVRSFLMRMLSLPLPHEPLVSTQIAWIGYAEDDFVAAPNGPVLVRRTVAPWVGDVLSGFAPLVEGVA